MHYSIQLKNIGDKFVDNGDGQVWTNHTYAFAMKTPSFLLHRYKECGYEYPQKNSNKLGFLLDNDEFINEIEDEFTPIYNYIHVLQQKPTSEQIKKVFNNAHNVAIISDPEYNYYISLTACGMDFSEEIAFSYMVIDNNIPASLTVSEEGKTTLNWAAYTELLSFIKRNK